VAYDQLCEQYPATAERQYVKLLELAATGSEERVAHALRQLVDSGTVISFERVATLCRSEPAAAPPNQMLLPAAVELAGYDALLTPQQEAPLWSS
jgi:hypothetical protein